MMSATSQKNKKTKKKKTKKKKKKKQTCLFNVDPIKPNFNIVKLGE